jgi:Tol biopolymer transport system component
VTPDPTTAPSTPGTPDATESTQTSQATSAELGTLFYGPAPGTIGDRTRLFSWTGSGAPQRGAEIPRLAAMLNATVSPDGRRVAWVDDAAALYVADVDGSGKRKLLDSVDGQCWGPVWSGDSRTLGVAVFDRTGEDYKDTKGVYDFDQERFYEVRQVSGCHPVWSARGDTVVYSDGSAGKVMITGGTLRTPSAIKGIGGPGQPFSLDLSSISPDGTKIALLLRPPGAEGGDVARELRVNAVVRTSDGQPIDLPLDGRGMTQAFFQPDGGLVVRVEDGDGYALVLVSPDGEKVTEVAEPAALRDMQIVSVAG